MEKRYLTDFSPTGVESLTPPKELLDAFIKDLPQDELTTIKMSLTWIRDNLKAIPFDRNIFRKRKAEQIVESRQSTGCSDDLIVFLEIMEKYGIDCTYIDVVTQDTIDKLRIDEDADIEAHVFAKLKIDDTVMIVDVTNAQIFNEVDFPDKTEFPTAVIIAEGRNFEETGLTSLKAIDAACLKLAREGGVSWGFL